MNGDHSYPIEGHENEVSGSTMFVLNNGFERSCVNLIHVTDSYGATVFSEIKRKKSIGIKETL